MSHARARNASGFTIIELVVVIVVLGILAATALPRFVDITGDAHSAAVEGVGSSIRSGVALTHASWIAKGASANVNAVQLEGGLDVGVTDAGWPQNTAAAGGDGTPTATECADLFTQILAGGPTVSTTAGTNDYTASVSGTTVCRYTYNAVPGRTIDYDVATGAVTITVP